MNLRLASTSTTRPAGPGARSGFTLIEILVVLTIVGLLMTFAAVSFGKYRESGRVTDCRMRIESLSLLIESYADRMGEYPPSRLADLGVADCNPVNEGVEALVAALRSERYAGRPPDERWLANADDDRAEGLRLGDGSDALLEVVDPWDQPLAYLVHAQYGQPATYRLGSDESALDVEVAARRNPLTGAWHRSDSFQLRSAGPDGTFDTEDDLANFTIEEPEREP